MKVLALNCGSASVKYRLFETSPEQAAADADLVLGGGTVENVGPYQDAVRQAVLSVVRVPEEIDAVGHRIVHGGDLFSQPALLNEETVREVEALEDLAPLHNPVQVAGYRAASAILPHCPHVAVFDTAFHQTMPREAYLYALPYEMSVRHKVRRYGFHGTSHGYVVERYARLRGGRPQDFKLITCHLGNGCSVAAVDRGRSVDTSMGFTPVEGLVMGSRTGDVDVVAVLHLMEKENLGIGEARDLLNKYSGLYGVSGLTNDMRVLAEERARGNPRARLAIDLFCRRVKKYIGAYYALLDGADAVVFTAGIGENRPDVRAQICEGLTSLGIAIETAENAAAVGREGCISAPGARCQVWVIPTREELMIARQAMACVCSTTPSRPVAP